MIENLNKLNVYDKLFMIYNKKFFSLPTQSLIIFKKDDLEKEFVNISANTKNFYMSVTSKASNEINELINQLHLPLASQDKYKKNLQSIIDMPSETIEDISDIINYFYINTFYYNTHTNVTVSSIDMKKIIKYFLGTLLPLKLTANEIYAKSVEKLITVDDNLRDFCARPIRIILREIMDNYSSIKKIAMLIYQLNKIFSENDKIKNYLIDLLSLYYDYDKDELTVLVDNLIHEKIDALTFINSIGDKYSNNDAIPDNDKSRNIENNYKKNIIAKEINNGGLCAGDNIFDDDYDENKLMVDLNALTIDHIIDYIGEYKTPLYEVPENDIGYLKSKEHIPISKVVSKNGRNSDMFTITRYKDKMFLLFKILGDKDCYGISFPSGYGGVRQLVIFDIPTDYRYVLQFN